MVGAGVAVPSTSAHGSRPISVESLPSTWSALKYVTLPVAFLSRMNGVAVPLPLVCRRKPCTPRVRNAAAKPVPLLTMFRHGSCAEFVVFLFDVQAAARAPPSPLLVLRDRTV